MPDEAPSGSAQARPPRSRFITWFLLGTGAAVLFLALCQRQKTLEKLDPWDSFLDDCGRTLVLSERTGLLETEAVDAVLVPVSRQDRLAQLSHGQDAEVFARALEEEGFGCVVADTADDARGDGRPLSVRERLAAYDGSHVLMARMLRTDAALFAPGSVPELDDALLDFLVEAARRSLSGEDPTSIDADAPPAATAVRQQGGWNVAVQLQGLPPRPVRSARASRIRWDLYAPGRGATLLSATMDAARALAREHEQKHEPTQGPLASLLDGIRLELHVMYEMALVDHVQGDLTRKDYERFLDRVVDPGITGLALNWTPHDPDRPPILSGYRVRLPPDVIYWSRPDGTRAVERLITDAHLGKLEDLAASEGVTLDRFRSVHVMERTPGGEVARVIRGRAVAPADALTDRELLDAVASKLARSVAPDGVMAQSYYPVRDVQWITGTSRPQSHHDVVQQALGTLALLRAGGVLDDAVLQSAARRAEARLLADVRLCGYPEDQPLHVPDLDGSAAPAPEKTRMELCGPLDAQGRPVAATSWGQGGVDPGPVASPMAFVVDRNAGSLAATSLALVALGMRPAPPDDQPDPLAPLVQGLVEFILMMQRPDGSFHSHFVAPSHPMDAISDPRASTMALWALARARDVSDDERIGAALSSGLQAAMKDLQAAASAPGSPSARCRRLTALAPFVTFAAAHAAPHLQDASRVALDAPSLLVKTCLLRPPEVLDADLAGGYVDSTWPIPGADDVLGGAASARALPLADGDQDANLLMARDLALDLARRLVVQPSMSDHFMVAPDTALWGVGRDLRNHRQVPWSAFAVVMLLSQMD